jgi:hypothetical protein
VYFGVLSISQPEARASRRESPGFVGFYGVFLDFEKIGVAVFVKMLRFSFSITLQVVASEQLGAQSPELE